MSEKAQFLVSGVHAMLSLKKISVTAVGVLALATAVAASSTPAAAGGRGGFDGDWVAPAIIGSVLVGGAVAAANSGYGPVGDPDCRLVRRPVFDEYGVQVGWRRARVCQAD
jgi:hypothetical protein